MSSFRLTRKAREDLKSIARYTQQTWGRKQRNKYLTLLDKRFSALAETRTLGHTCDEIRPGYRKFHEGRHIIYYRAAADGIEIVRILHASMDVERHL
jgi:toxin ParE1/3/4